MVCGICIQMGYRHEALETQMEMVKAVVHGIRSVKSSLAMTNKEVCLVDRCGVGVGGGGGISGAGNFVWEIARFQLATKFPTQIPGSSTPVAQLHRPHHNISGSVREIYLTKSMGFREISCSDTPANSFWHVTPPPCTCGSAKWPTMIFSPKKH